MSSSILPPFKRSKKLLLACCQATSEEWPSAKEQTRFAKGHGTSLLMNCCHAGCSGLSRAWQRCCACFPRGQEIASPVPPALGRRRPASRTLCRFGTSDWRRAPPRQKWRVRSCHAMSLRQHASCAAPWCPWLAMSGLAPMPSTWWRKVDLQKPEKHPGMPLGYFLLSLIWDQGVSNREARNSSGARQIFQNLGPGRDELVMAVATMRA